MKSVWRWIEKNRGLAKILAILLYVGVSIPCLLAEAGPFWLTILLPLLAALVLINLLRKSNVKVMEEPLKILNEKCDPYPYLEETERQLQYNKKGIWRQIAQINYAMALRDVGQYQKAWEILKGIHIDKYVALSTNVKLVYYNNLADILTRMGKYAEAEVWYRKELQLYQDLPDNKWKQQVKGAIEGATAASWYRQGDYVRAKECVQRIQPENLLAHVSACMSKARCCTALEEIQEAREHLKFVIDNGNRLYVVEEAKELLAKLEESSDRVEEE